MEGKDIYQEGLNNSELIGLENLMRLPRKDMVIPTEA